MRHARMYHAPEGLAALSAGTPAPDERLMNGRFAPGRVAPVDAGGPGTPFGDGPGTGARLL